MNLITLDFETFYDDEYSLSKISTEEYIRHELFEIIGVSVRVNDQEPEWFSGTHEETVQFLQQFDWKESCLLAHHTAFDGAILKWRCGITPKFYLDTLSMARPVTGATVGGSLAALAKKFMLGEKGTEVVKAKGKRRKHFQPNELSEYGEYCINDNILTYNLFHVLREWSTEREMFIIDTMLRMFIDPVLGINHEVVYQHLCEVQDKKAQLLARVSHDTVALRSDQQFADLLESYGVEPPTKVNKNGQVKYAFAKTDQEFKELLEHENLDVQALVAARLGVKTTLEETRTKRFMEICKRGTLAVLLNYYGAHTGRASGGDKINLQNLPRGGKLRRALIPPLGHMIVAGDSSQIEARVVAWWAGQDDLVQAFAAGVDIYSVFATEVYGRTVTKADTTDRFVGKTCILGLGYGMGHERLKRTLKIGQGGVSADVPLDECERIVKQVYRKKYAKIAQLWRDCQYALEKAAKGFTTEIGVNLKLVWDSEGIHLPNGMLLRYANLREQRNAKGEQEYVYDTRRGAVKLYGAKVVENVVQALARIVVFNQMAAISQRFRSMDRPEEGARFVVALTVHDEIVTVVPEEWAKPALVLLENQMKVAPKWAPGLPVTCEVGAAACYADC
jgi:DNA polymerase I-like protein with 3'-5' exonuclease and polymerase domains